MSENQAVKWIDPNDKTQSRYLPHIGEPVLFCHQGKTYYGLHTGGSFKTGHGVTAKLFPTWDCMWMPLPEPADKQKGGQTAEREACARMLDQLEQQRDELLAVLERIASTEIAHKADALWDALCMRHAAKDAVAKVKGGAT